MVLRGWRDATMAPTTEKVSNVAKLRTTLPSSASPPYGNSTAVDLVVRAKVIPPRRSATESATSDQASQEAARVLIPPTPCSCSLAPSVTTPLYSTTLSKALRQSLRSQVVSELPRTPLLGTSVNKVAHKLGTASQGRDAVPFEVAVRLGWLLPCLPGDRRRCGGRRRFGDRFGLLCFVHAASEDVAHPDGSDHDTNEDQYPVVPYQVEVHQHRGGRYGERSQGAPGGVVHRVGDGGRPNAARIDPQVAKEEARRHDGPVEEGHEEQHVTYGEELGDEVVKGHVPGGPDETD